MAYRITTFLAFFLVAAGLYGQTAHIEGKLRLKDESAPPLGVHVYLEKTTLGAYTDSQGEFVIREAPPGQYELVATFMGYATLRVPVVIQANQTLGLELEMDESVVGLPQALVQSVSLTGGLRGLRDVPGSAQFLGPRELRQFNYTDASRVLRLAPGVNIQEEDGFGLRPNIGLRGAGAERSAKITLMEDGILAAPAPYAAPAAYYFPTIGRMQGVEILKGSSQVRFGPYTTGGAINFLSTPIPAAFSGALDLMAGSFGARNLHAHAGNSHRNFGYLVETFQYRADGFKELDGGGEAGFDKKDYLLQFRLNTGPKAKVYQSLHLKMGQAIEISDETYLGLSDEDFRQTPLRRYAASQKDRMDTRHNQLSLRHAVQFSPAIDLATTVYQNRFHRNWYKLDKLKDSQGQSVGISALLENPDQWPEAFSMLGGGAGPHLEVKANNRTYLSQGVQTLAGFRFGGGAVSHSLDLGLRYHYDEMDRFQWVDVFRMEEGIMYLNQAGEPGTESNRILAATAFAAYGQYKVKAGRWTFLPGLRFEDIDLQERDFGKANPGREGEPLKIKLNRVQVFIPGIGADYRIAKEVHLFGGVHRGFAPPGAAEGAQPERSVNYELGGRLERSGFSGQAAIFFNDFDNLLGADLAAGGGTGSGDLFNGGRARVGGLELQGQYDLLAARRVSWRMPLSLVYTYTEGAFLSDFNSDFDGWGQVAKGDAMPYLAPHQASLTLGCEGAHWGFNLGARAQSAMRTAPGQGTVSDERKADGFILADLAGYYRLHRHFSIFASANNLFNQTFIVARQPAGLRPALPRAFMAGAKIQF